MIFLLQNVFISITLLEIVCTPLRATIILSNILEGLQDPQALEGKWCL